MAKPKLTKGLSYSAYEELQALRFSQLKLLAKSAAHYQFALTDQPKDTDAFRVGRALHCAVLEPKEFKKRYSVYSERRAGKTWEAFQAAHVGTDILTLNQALVVSNLSMAARKDPTAARLLQGITAEVTLEWELDGRPLKARLDGVSAKGIIDLKTTKNASPTDFGRQAFQLQYLSQAAWYVDGHQAVTGKVLPFYFIAIENIAPYPVAVYSLNEEQLEWGRESYRLLLERLEVCERSGNYPSYVNGIQALTLPPWALPDESESEDVTGIGLVFNRSSTQDKED